MFLGLLKLRYDKNKIRQKRRKYSTCTCTNKIEAGELYVWRPLYCVRWLLEITTATSSRQPVHGWFCPGTPRPSVELNAAPHRASRELRTLCRKWKIVMVEQLKFCVAGDD